MSADVSVDKSVGVSVDVSASVSTGVAVGAFADVSVSDRGLPWYAVSAAVELAVEIATASCNGPPRCSVTCRGIPWKPMKGQR